MLKILTAAALLCACGGTAADPHAHVVEPSLTCSDLVKKLGLDPNNVADQSCTDTLTVVRWEGVPPDGPNPNNLNDHDWWKQAMTVDSGVPGDDSALAGECTTGGYGALLMYSKTACPQL